MIGLCISCSSQSILLLETCALIDRIIEFGIGIAHLTAENEEFKSLYL